ncbi:MAG: cytochrome c [Dehalococcoidia bacterium]|nr:cytochrome c [Dehalococcoidia bacterium]
MVFYLISSLVALPYRRATVLLTLALAFAAILACSPSGKDDAIVSPTPVATVVVVRSGEALFSGICASCHGLSGEGQPNWHIRKEDGTLPPPPLNGDGHTWHHGDGFLYKVVRDGGKWMESPDIPHFKSGMPAFGEQLSHDEIVGVITYVKSLWGDKTGRGMSIREWQAEVSLKDPFPAGP